MITTSEDYSVNTVFFPDDYQNPTFIWGFSWDSNADGNAIIKWIKISINEYTSPGFIPESGTWELENIQLYRSGYTSYPPYYHSASWGHYSTYTKCCILYHNFLYCISYDKTKIYKISIENPSNRTYLEYPESGTCHIPEMFANYSTSSNSSCAFNIANDVIYFPNGYILNDAIIPVLSNTSQTWNDVRSYNSGLYNYSAPGLKCGPYLFGFYSDNYVRSDGSHYIYYYYTVCIEKNYLATINNLITPIEKNDEKIMKITYTLIETEE